MLCLALSLSILATGCLRKIGHPPMRSVFVPLSAVPGNVMAKFNQDYGPANIIVTERCSVGDSTIFYAVRFAAKGQQQVALISPQAKVEMVYDEGEAPPRQLLLTNTIGASTDFRLFRKRLDGAWSEGVVYPRSNAVAVVRALEGAMLWDGVSHVPDQRMPGVGIGLDWSSDVSERKVRAVWLCKGNRLVWHTDCFYEVPDEAWKIIEKIFPENQ